MNFRNCDETRRGERSLLLRVAVLVFTVLALRVVHNIPVDEDPFWLCDGAGSCVENTSFTRSLNIGGAHAR